MVMALFSAGQQNKERLRRYNNSNTKIGHRYHIPAYTASMDGSSSNPMRLLSLLPDTFISFRLGSARICFKVTIWL